MEIGIWKMHRRRTGAAVTLVALTVAVLLRLSAIRVETSTAPSAENNEPLGIDKTEQNIRALLVPIATASVDGGLHLLTALNDNGIGARMEGSRTVAVYVTNEDKAEALGVLAMLGRKDIRIIREDSLTPKE